MSVTEERVREIVNEMAPTECLATIAFVLGILGGGTFLFLDWFGHAIPSVKRCEAANGTAVLVLGPAHNVGCVRNDVVIVDSLRKR